MEVIRIKTNSKTTLIDKASNLNFDGSNVHAWTAHNQGNVTAYVNDVRIPPNAHWGYGGNISVDNGIAYVTVDVTKVSIIFDADEQKALLANGEVINKEVIIVEQVI
ncbi:MAG: hypothetical protein ACPG5B_06790 [Chitinophagales bacterium]